MKEIESILRKHWSSEAVITDILDPKTQEQLAEDELLSGELSAGIIKAGDYIVRIAQRVYKISEPGYTPENEMPADEAELAAVKEYFDKKPFSMWFFNCEWRDKLRFTREISVRHADNQNKVFTYICRATQARNNSWYEYIRSICTAKENERIPDEYASLFVCNRYTGDSFSADTWYRISPTGKITTLELHPYDPKMDEARFT